MAYIDTSALVAYYCPESQSQAVERLLLSMPQPHISHLTDVEIASAISRKIRYNELSSSNGNRIFNLYQNHINQGLFSWLPLDLNHFQMAKSWISQFSTALRTLDALHLAIAQANDLPILSLDMQLIEATEYFGIQTMLIR
jgi:uncharacterized protein